MEEIRRKRLYLRERGNKTSLSSSILGIGILVKKCKSRFEGNSLKFLKMDSKEIFLKRNIFKGNIFKIRNIFKGNVKKRNIS